MSVREMGCSEMAWLETVELENETEDSLNFTVSEKDSKQLSIVQLLGLYPWHGKTNSFYSLSTLTAIS